MRPRSIIAILITMGVLGLATMAACGQDTTPAPQPPDEAMAAGAQSTSALSGRAQGLWASGQGRITGQPDLAVLSVGVEAMAPTVAEANSEASQALDGMIGVLRASGLEDADIQTSSLNIRQEYDSREVTRCPEVDPAKDSAMAPAMAPATSSAGTAAPEDTSELAMGEMLAAAMAAGFAMEFGAQQGCFTTYERVVSGYVVSQQLKAKVRDLDSAGGLIDKLAEAGGDLTRIEGINFTIEDPAPLQEQAREMAVQDMLSRANGMATAAGVRLGNLVHLSESSSNVLGSRESFYEYEGALAMAVNDTASTSVSGGEITVTANVSGGFDIVQPDEG